MIAPLLLDTCAALFLAAGAPMGEPAAAAIDAAGARGETIFLSPVTAWEVGLMAQRRLFRPMMTPERWWERLISAPGLAAAPLTPAVLLGAPLLPGTLPDDPGGRIVAATAREFGYTVVTRDPALLAYGLEGHIRVLAC